MSVAAAPGSRWCQWPQLSLRSLLAQVERHSSTPDTPSSLGAHTFDPLQASLHNHIPALASCELPRLPSSETEGILCFSFFHFSVEGDMHADPDARTLLPQDLCLAGPFSCVRSFLMSHSFSTKASPSTQFHSRFSVIFNIIVLCLHWNTGPAIPGPTPDFLALFPQVWYGLDHH